MSKEYEGTRPLGVWTVSGWADDLVVPQVRVKSHIGILHALKQGSSNSNVHKNYLEFCESADFASTCLVEAWGSAFLTSSPGVDAAGSVDHTLE